MKGIFFENSYHYKTKKTHKADKMSTFKFNLIDLKIEFDERKNLSIISKGRNRPK